MSRLCLECGATVPPRVKGCGGNQPGFCSDQCRRERKQKTLAKWVVVNRERKLALDAECRKRQKRSKPDYFREHYANNREKRKRQASEWYHANAEYALERQKAYVATRPIEVRRAIGRRSANKRRAIKNLVFVEVVDARTVFKRDNGVCGICKREVDVTSPWEVDHIVPISKGGLHCYANVQLSHKKCNRSKGAKTQVA